MIPTLPKGYSHPLPIGNGGFGEVFRVRQNALNRFVACKFIHDKSAKNRNALKNEAEMQAGLHLNGIPQIYDVLEYSNTICIVMQWIHGCNLSTLKAQHISQNDTFSIVTELLQIVVLLHSKGYAHRDIKPENILVSAEGVFLIDFGLSNSKYVSRYDANPNVVKGTYDYIAPELWQGNNQFPDYQKADIYSLGMVIAELFDNADLPSCVQVALSKDPDKRYATAQEFLVAWENCISDSSSNWREIAARNADDLLAAQLLSGVKSLLKRGRKDEAYQLLIECIKVNPENPAAIELMEHFPMHDQHVKVTIVKSLLVIVTLSCCIAGLLYVSNLKGKKNSFEAAKANSAGDSKSISVESPMWHNGSYDRMLPLKDLHSDCKAISGRMYIAECPNDGHLLIDDNRTISDTGAFNFSFPLSEHKCLFESPDGNIVWKEVITILPFEEKRIWIKRSN